MPYQSSAVHSHPGMQIPGMKVKQSTRWIMNYSRDCERVFNVPYISVSGKESIHTLVEWKCHPMQLVGSLASTVYSRILKILIQRHRYRRAKEYRSILLQVSIAYVVTRNPWIIDRFLGITRFHSRKKVANSLVQKFVCKLDDIQRFVYSQAFNQAYWLTSRSERPRDKSSVTKMKAFPDLFMVDPDTPCICDRFGCLYGDLWTTDIPTGNPIGFSSYDSQSDYSAW